jgi:hypothetical protein
MSKLKTNVTGAKPIIAPAAYSMDAFCEAHHVSRPLLYMLWAEGTGPQFFYVGSKRLISAEAAQRWRQEREAAAIAAE